MERTESKTSLVKRERDYRKRIERAKENFSKTFGSSGKKRIVWIIILICTTGGFAFHFSELAYYYNQYILSTTPSGDGVAFEFPDVTICPNGWLPAVKLSAFSKLLEKNYGIPFANPKINYYHDMFEENLQRFWSLTLFDSLNSDSVDLIDKQNIYRASQRTFAKYVAERDLLLGPEDTLLECSYAGHDCPLKNFTILYGEHGGFCFRFSTNIEWRGEMDDRSGLFMKLKNDYIIGELYAKEFMKGLKVYFHQKNTWPNFAEPSEYNENYIIKKIFVSMEKKKRIDTPVQRCTRQYLDKRCHISRGGLVCYPYLYNFDVCMQDYYQKELYKQCGCISDEWLIIEKMKEFPTCYSLPNLVFENQGYVQQGNQIFVKHPFNDNQTISLESFVDIESVRKRYQCFLDFLKLENLRILRQQSSCFEDCDVTYYEYERIIHEIINDKERKDLWLPFEKELTAAAARIGAQNFNNASMIYSRDIIRNLITDSGAYSWTILTINSKEIRSAFEEQFLYYSLTKLLSDLGGTLGCWLGCSVATVFEFLELAYLLWAYCRFKKDDTDIEMTNTES